MTDSRSGGAGIIIPQPPYIPQTKKYFVAQAPVIFCTNGTLGIRLSDALSGTCIGLLHRDDYAFPRLDSAKLSFRLEWPAVGGEALSYTHHISNTGRNITVGRLAQKIAKEVGRFIDTYTTSSQIDEQWRVGPNLICLERLWLINVCHVSTASIQPTLRLV